MRFMSVRSLPDRNLPARAAIHIYPDDRAIIALKLEPIDVARNIRLDAYVAAATRLSCTAKQFLKAAILTFLTLDPGMFLIGNLTRLSLCRGRLCHQPGHRQSQAGHTPCRRQQAL